MIRAKWPIALALAGAGSIATLALAGCSYTFDDEAPDLPLVGTPPATASLTRLNHQPASVLVVLWGHDGVPWAELDEQVTQDGVTQVGLRFVRLVDPPAEELLVHDFTRAISNYDTYYFLDPPASGNAEDPNQLTVHYVGGSRDPDLHFELPPGNGMLQPDWYNRLFVYWPVGADAKGILVKWLDGSFERTVPLPEGVDPEDPFAGGGGIDTFLLNSDFLTVDKEGALVLHSVSSEVDIPLGVRPRHFQDDDHLVTCGDDGVRLVPLDGSPDTVVDAEPCDANGYFSTRGKFLYYPKGGALWRIPRDRSAPAERVLDATLRLLTFAPDEEPVYSTDPADRYTAGAGDGWLGKWRFMERGRAIAFSQDGERLHWLEHAAQQGGIGDLYSASRLGAPLHLARNVRYYDLLSDGRILAAANHAFRGVQNRIITIDEEARVAYWVADQASDYLHIPGTDDLLVDIVTGPSTFDVVRVHIPPKP